MQAMATMVAVAVACQATLDERLCITVPEATAMLGISRNFAYELVNRGEIPVIIFGKRKLMPRAALEKMLERV